MCIRDRSTDVTLNAAVPTDSLVKVTAVYSFTFKDEMCIRDSLKSGTDVRGTAVNPDDPKKIDLTDEVLAPVFYEQARLLGEEIARHSCEVVYGGTNCGLMLSLIHI